MTDIEAKRDKVIAAARRITRNGSGFTFADVVAVEVAVDELDAALKPDPWQLLDRVGDSGARFDGVLFGDIKAALTWRKENPNE